MRGLAATVGTWATKLEEDRAKAADRALAIVAASQVTALSELHADVQEVRRAQAGTHGVVKALQAKAEAPAAPVVVENHVHVPQQPAPEVHVTNEVRIPAERTLRVTRDDAGKITGGEIKDGK